MYGVVAHVWSYFLGMESQIFENDHLRSCRDCKILMAIIDVMVVLYVAF